MSSVDSNGPDRAGPSKCLGACPEVLYFLAASLSPGEVRVSVAAHSLSMSGLPRGRCRAVGMRRNPAGAPHTAAAHG